MTRSEFEALVEMIEAIVDRAALPPTDLSDFEVAEAKDKAWQELKDVGA